MFNLNKFFSRLFSKEIEVTHKSYRFDNLTVKFIIDDAMPDVEFYRVEKTAEGLQYNTDSIGHLVEEIIAMRGYSGMFGNEKLLGYQCNTDVYYHVIGMYDYMSKGETQNALP